MNYNVCHNCGDKVKDYAYLCNGIKCKLCHHQCGLPLKLTEVQKTVYTTLVCLKKRGIIVPKDVLKIIFNTMKPNIFFGSSKWHMSYMWTETVHRKFEELIDCYRIGHHICPRHINPGCSAISNPLAAVSNECLKTHHNMSMGKMCPRCHLLNRCRILPCKKLVYFDSKEHRESKVCKDHGEYQLCSMKCGATNNMVLEVVHGYHGVARKIWLCDQCTHKATLSSACTNCAQFFKKESFFVFGYQPGTWCLRCMKKNPYNHPFNPSIPEYRLVSVLLWYGYRHGLHKYFVRYSQNLGIPDIPFVAKLLLRMWLDCENNLLKYQRNIKFILTDRKPGILQEYYAELGKQSNHIDLYWYILTLPVSIFRRIVDIYSHI